MAGVDAPRRRPALACIHAPLLFSTPSPSHLRRRPVHVVFQQARSFLWRHAHIRLDVEGDVGRAVAVYPLGPLLFVATVALVVYGLYVLVTRRAVQINLSPAMVRGVLVIGFVALGLNWIAKLVWLGM